MISRRNRAERYGYINRALPVDELTPFVEKLAHRIALFPAHAIAHGKAAVDAGAFSCMAEGLLAEVHESDLSAASEVTQARVTEALKVGAGDGSFIQTFPDKITGECVLFLFRGEDGCIVLRARLGTQITPICILQCHGDRNGILVASRGRHIVGLSPYVRKVPTAVGETEALWRALINLVAEPADAPERQSFELLRNDCPCEQRD